jgi:hypothetical protein
MTFRVLPTIFGRNSWPSSNKASVVERVAQNLPADIDAWRLERHEVGERDSDQPTSLPMTFIAVRW